MKKLLALSLLLTFLPNVVLAKSFYCTNCSTRFVQSVERAQSAKQLGELYKQVSESVKQTQAQLQLVQNSIMQYENMLQNTKQLPQNLTKELNGKLIELANLTKELKTQRGDLTSLGQIFNEVFPGQELFKGFATAKTPEEVAEANAKYQAHWDEWSSRVDQAAMATFQISGKQLEELQDSGKLQSYLDSLLSTPDGQMKAIMAGNQLSSIQIQEARQLRELFATKAQSDLQTQMKLEKESQMMQEQWRDATKTDRLKKLEVKPDPF